MMFVMRTSLLQRSMNGSGPRALLSSPIQVSEVKASPRHSMSKCSPSGTSKTCHKLELSDLWFEVLGVINTCKIHAVLPSSVFCLFPSIYVLS